MKKKITIICIGCLLLFANSLPARSKRGKAGWDDLSPRAEWYLAYGFPNVPANVLPSQSSTLGPISFGYKHVINEKLSWGLSLRGYMVGCVNGVCHMVSCVQSIMGHIYSAKAKETPATIVK